MVASLVTLFKKLKFVTDENVGWGPIDLPEIELQTTAYWLTAESAASVGWRKDELDVALIGAGRAIQAVAAVLLMVDPRDLGLVTQVRSPHSRGTDDLPVRGGAGRRRASRSGCASATTSWSPARRRSSRPAPATPAARPAPDRGSSRTWTARRSRCGSSRAARAPAVRRGGRGGRRREPLAGMTRRRRSRAAVRQRSAPAACAPTASRRRRRRAVAPSAIGGRATGGGASAATRADAARARSSWSRSPTTLLPVDRERLATLPGQPPADAPLLCLDTETTGLATAAGTLAFLVGLGWWEGSRFRQVQLLLPDHADEPALLAELAARDPARRLARDLQRARVRLAAARGAVPAWPGRTRRSTPATSTCCRSSAGCSATGWTTPGCASVESELLGREPARRRRGLGDPGALPRLPALRRAGAARRRRPPQRRGRPLARAAARPRRPRLRGRTSAGTRRRRATSPGSSRAFAGEGRHDEALELPGRGARRRARPPAPRTGEYDEPAPERARLAARESRADDDVVVVAAPARRTSAGRRVGTRPSRRGTRPSRAGATRRGRRRGCWPSGRGCCGGSAGTRDAEAAWVGARGGARDDRRAGAGSRSRSSASTASATSRGALRRRPRRCGSPSVRPGSGRPLPRLETALGAAARAARRPGHARPRQRAPATAGEIRHAEQARALDRRASGRGRERCRVASTGSRDRRAERSRRAARRGTRRRRRSGRRRPSDGIAG